MDGSAQEVSGCGPWGRGLGLLVVGLRWGLILRVSSSFDHSGVLQDARPFLCSQEPLPSLAVPVTLTGLLHHRGITTRFGDTCPSGCQARGTPVNPLSKQGAAFPASTPDPRELSPQTTGICPCGMLGRLMSRIWPFQAWFELFFIFWTTQTLPEASFLEKSEHFRIYGLREELEFSSVSLGSCSGAPAWPCPHPRRGGGGGTRDCPR